MSAPECGTFGEPWHVNVSHGDIYTNEAKRLTFHVELMERAEACVNAMAGISDPAAFRKAAEELAVIVEANGGDHLSVISARLNAFRSAQGGTK